MKRYVCPLLAFFSSVIDGLGLEAHDVVLDLGCGDGRWLVAAALKGCHGRGFDLNKDLLEKGRRATAEAGVSFVTMF